MQTARKLHETTRELAGSGALARARHGPSLREQIGERERTLAHLDRALERLERELRMTRERALAIARAEPRSERGVTPRRTLERGLAREQSLGRGIEI